MEEPWNTLINKAISLRVSDWLDSLIGPSELLKMLLCSELVTCCFSRYFVMCVGILYEGKMDMDCMYLFDPVNLSCLSI
jgi:hypothetical protein